MRSDDPSLDVPSAPLPSELPRPRMQRMSDVRPPVKNQAPQPPVQPVATDQPAQVTANEESVQPPKTTVDDVLSRPVAPLPEPPKKKRSIAKKLFIGFACTALIAVIAIIGAFVWYQQQLQPVAAESKDHIRVVIKSGSTPSMIASELKENKVIRNETAFLIYTQVTKTRDDLKAGSYNLKPSESLPQIVAHLVSGKQDEFSLTFLPGDTLANHRKRIISAGYSAQEVDAALAKTYNRPLFEGKPASADLEGYIYGETYQFLSSATVEDILNKTFDQYEKEVTANNLVAGFKKQGLNLYQGITLASIVQREVPTTGDQKQVAEVFFNRIKEGMTLGSDVTYQYAADKMNVARDPMLDSPYNTRRYTGLPPGPIASPGLTALQAVASPASSDYLFFLSGDDNKTYFGRTSAEHEQNIVLHCQKKCAIL